MAKTETDWRGRLALLAAALILVAWLVSFTIDIWVETYDPPASVTPMAMAAVGFLFATETMAKLTQKPKPPEPEPRPKEVET